MKYLEIFRLEFSNDGVFGIIKYDNKILHSLYSLELPFNDNKKYISSIPAGEYKALVSTSERLGDTIELLEVPNRTDIMFHVGNTIDDLKGCIGIGNRIRNNMKNSRRVMRDRGLSHSKPAMKRLIKLIGRDTFMVRIHDTKELS